MKVFIIAALVILVGAFCAPQGRAADWPTMMQARGVFCQDKDYVVEILKTMKDKGAPEAVKVFQRLASEQHGEGSAKCVATEALVLVKEELYTMKNIRLPDGKIIDGHILAISAPGDDTVHFHLVFTPAKNNEV